MSKHTLLALLAAASATGFTACGNARNESDTSDRLDGQVCTQDDVGPGFNHQTSGDFSPRNLADLGDEAPARLAAYRAAGMLKGHFVYWKEVSGKPPFDPPLDVVCQVVEFQTAAQARTFVSSLAASEVASTLIGWLPEHFESFHAETPPLGDAARGFELHGIGDAGPVTVTGIMVAAGKYVRSISAGGPSTGPKIGQAIALQVRVAGRAD